MIVGRKMGEGIESSYKSGGFKVLVPSLGIYSVYVQKIIIANAKNLQ